MGHGKNPAQASTGLPDPKLLAHAPAPAGAPRRHNSAWEGERTRGVGRAAPLMALPGPLGPGPGCPGLPRPDPSSAGPPGTPPGATGRPTVLGAPGRFAAQTTRAKNLTDKSFIHIVLNVHTKSYVSIVHL